MRKNFIALTFVSLALATPAHAITRDIVFPVDGPASFQNDFNDPRDNGTRQHLGIDILTDKMTPVVSAVDGTVSYVVSPEASWGYSVSIRDAEGYQYRYLHLNNDTPGTDDGKGGEEHAYASSTKRGAKVSKGDLIGWAGDSGNAEETVSHLHFEIRDPSRIPINPFESLRAAASSAKNILVQESKSPIGVEPQVAPSSTLESAASTYVFKKPLSVGSRGEDVGQLQMRLKGLGYFDYPEITGYFGPVTEASVVKFQRKASIDPIGIVGPLTRAALNAI